MTRKHFNALASALRAARPDIDEAAFHTLIHAIADICANANPSFSRDKFIYAIMEH